MFDKRLFKLVDGCVGKLAVTVVLRWLSFLARIVALVVLGRGVAAFCTGTYGQEPWSAFAPAACVAVVACYAFQAFAVRCAGVLSAHAVSSVTQALYNKLVRLGPSYGNVVDADEAVLLMGEGVERLRPYFSNYLPQFFFAVLAPLTLFVLTAPFALLPAAVMLLCVVLMPASIMLLMKHAKKFMGRYWGTYVDLGGSFADAIRGLTALKVYRADGRMQDRLDEQAEGFRQVTMKLLRVQLNSVTLMDLFSYGGMAAGMGCALAQAASGNLPLETAVVLVFLAPGFFMPMRSFGAQFHTGMNANEVVDQVFRVLEAHEPLQGEKGVPHAAPDIVCTGLTCGYTGDVHVLHGVDLHVAPLTFTGITGESGSGKSTLLCALAGQLPAYEGSIRLCGCELRELSPQGVQSLVTIVSRESHVFKGTVRANLLLGKPDANDYEMWEALRKARLDDFIIAIGGLSSELDEGGANLSGGQRQRLCFARAILRDTPIYLFDEAASSVDVESEKKLLTVIQELSLTKTVLLVTHRLASLTRADEVHVMEGGRVVESGTHYSLVRRENGVYQRLWQQNAQLEDFATMADGLQMDDTYEPNEVEKILDKLPPQASKMMYAALMARDALKYKRQVEGDAYDPVTLGHPEWIPLPDTVSSHKAPGSDAVQVLDGADGTGATESDAAAASSAPLATLRRLSRVMRRMRGEVCAAIVLGALAHVAAVAVPDCAVAAAFALALQGGATPVAGIAAAMVACAALRGPLHYAERLLTHDQTFKTLALLRGRVFAQMRLLAPARLETRDSGDLISLLTSDIEQLEGFYSRTVVPVASAALAVIAVCAACVLMGAPKIACVAVAVSVVVGMLCPLAAARATREKARDLRVFSVNMTSFLLDSLRGFGDLLQFGRAAEYSQEMERHFGTRASGEAGLATTMALVSPLAACAALLGSVAVLFCGLAGVNAGELAPSTAALCTVLCAAMFDRVASTADVGFSLSRTLASAERVTGLLDEQPQTLDVLQGARLEGFDGAQAHNVSFTYPGAPAPALSGIDFSVSKGALVRVTGKSGAGKSTLLKLLMRFWDVDSGQILVSGEDVRNVATADLRESQAYMTQETYLFEGTLRENLLFGRHCDSKKVDELVEQVRLGGLVSRLEHGLDTQVGGAQGAGMLSQGERQRVGLARALLHGAPLLLLDEPTSNLDSLSEAAVLYALAATTQDKTVIVVSHRRAVAALADATFVVRKQG